MKKVVRYFVDMDGTLARFYKDENCLRRMYERGYFENLLPYEKLVNDIRNLIKCGRNVYILSKCVDTPYCAVEKIAWLKKYLPEINPEKIILIGDEMTKVEKVKQLGFADDVNILIDDYGKNLTEWETGLRNGVAIKVLNEINEKTNKTYCGIMIAE